MRIGLMSQFDQGTPMKQDASEQGDAGPEPTEESLRQAEPGGEAGGLSAHALLAVVRRARKTRGESGGPIIPQ